MFAATFNNLSERLGAFAGFVVLFTLISLFMPVILSQALIPIAILLSLIAIFRKRFLVGVVCFLLSVMAMSSVIDKQAQLQKSLDQIKNIR